MSTQLTDEALKQRWFPAWAGGLLWECPHCAAGYEQKDSLLAHIDRSHTIKEHKK